MSKVFLGKNNLQTEQKQRDGEKSADELESNPNVVRCGREVRNTLLLLRLLLLFLSLSLFFSLSLSLSRCTKTRCKSLLSTDFFSLSLSCK